MLSKNLRLTENYDYNRVRKYGKAYHTSLFIFSYMKDPRLLPTEVKFGFVVSNKIDKRAVVRNKIKRIFSRLIYDNLSKFPKGYLFVLISKSLAVGKSYEEIATEFNQVLSKISFTGSRVA